MKPLKAIAYASVLVLLVWQIWDVRDGLGGSVRSVGWRATGIATGFSVLSQFPSFLAWRRLVAGAGVRLSLSDAAWIFFMSGATRYLPGAIWPAVTQAAMAKRFGAPRVRLMATGVAAVVLTALSGCLVGLLAFPRLVADDPMWWLMLPVLLSAAAVMMSPRLLGRLLALGQRVLRQGEHEIELPDRRTSMGMISLSVLAWCCNGMHAAVIAIALGVPAWPAVTLGVGGFTLSAVAGALSLTPAGIGVREVVLGVTLGVLLTGPNLVTLLLLSRVLTTFGHVSVTLAVLGLLTGTRYAGRRRNKEKPTSPVPTS
ncbi:YbhN family protein [Streptomyces sp. NPDC005840]|uniref:lysylphosphatidylglycerol synthase transmembrane domain-containing protein n=1 Tax=Streptomyces sp. NPDC005840 TaxID=3157072 RepID=UPI00340DA0B9